MEVADGDDPLRLLSGGRRAEDAEQGGKRCKRDADDPPQAGTGAPSIMRALSHQQGGPAMPLMMLT